MQNNWKQILSELAPQFFILLIVIFILFFLISRRKKNIGKAVDDLKKQEPENFEKLIKFNAYLKLFLWSGFGLFLIGGGVYNSMLFPAGNQLPALFMASFGIGFVGFGVWSFFKEKRNLRIKIYEK